MPKTCIVISTYNRLELLRQTIDSLLLSFDKEKADIFVINDGSDRDTYEYLNGHSPNLKQLTWNENKGLRYVMNYMIGYFRNLSYDYISYVQDDVAFKKGWLDECMDLWENQSTLYKIGFVTGHDAPEHPTIFEVNKKCLIKDTCRATHLFASKKRWLEFGEIPDLTPGIAAPRDGQGSKVDWWLIGHPEDKYPHSENSLKNKGEKVLCIPGLIVHRGWNQSTWGMINPEKYYVVE